MHAPAEKVASFRALHYKGAAFLFPNFWDVGSARILEGLGFPALASTSSGFALTKGRGDYGVTREEAIAHAGEVSAAVRVPVAADLEDGFGPAPEDCAETIRRAAAAGLCGGSIEDSGGAGQRGVIDAILAAERVAAAAEAARAAPDGFVLTARAEAFLYGEADLGEVIARLQSFEAAGADVLFAPGLPDLDAVKAVCSSVSRPVSVMVWGALMRHSVDEFSEAGVARLSLGGALASEAYATLAEQATAIRTGGRFDMFGKRRDAQAKVRAIIRG